MTAIWGFVALCIIFNIWSVPTGLNTDFDTTTPFIENVFEDFNTSQISETYISFWGLEGRVAERMRAKFDSLQISVDERAIAGDSYAPYFGEHTYIMHTSLFREWTFNVFWVIIIA